MYKTLHKKQGSVTVQLRFARSSVTFCAKRDNKGIKKEGCKYPWLDLKLLENEPFILQPPDQRTRQTVDQLFKSCHIHPQICLQTGNIPAAAELASQGYGACFVTETHLKHIPFKKKPVLFSVGTPNTTVDFVAAFRKGSYLSYHAQEYIKIVRDFT